MTTEDKKGGSALKLPIGSEDEDNMDFLDVDEEELVHDVKQAVSPTSSRSLDNPDFNGINLLLSSTNAINGMSAMLANQSGQFVPYLGHPVLFPGNNQNIFNLVALCISTPPPFNGLPQNNPFFLSNGINEHIGSVPFSANAPFFYFGLPEDTQMGVGGATMPHSGKCCIGRNAANCFGGAGMMAGGGFSGASLAEFEMDCVASPLEMEMQYAPARQKSNLIQNTGIHPSDGLNEYNTGSSKINKLGSNYSDILNNSNIGSGAVMHQSLDLVEGEVNASVYYDFGLNMEGKGGYNHNNNNGLLSEQGMHQVPIQNNNTYLSANHQNTACYFKRQSLSKSTGNVNAVGSSPSSTTTVSGEKKNRWQLSDPQFKSGYKGVSWNSRMEAWLAFFVENGVRKSKTFSSRKFGFNRAREKAIKYLDARRKGIILTTPPPLSPSKGIYDRIPQQRKPEPSDEGNFSVASQQYQRFPSFLDNINENNPSISSKNTQSNRIGCTQTMEGSQRIICS